MTDLVIIGGGPAGVSAAVADLPICVGDVIIKNVFGSNVVATQNRNDNCIKGV